MDLPNRSPAESFFDGEMFDQVIYTKDLFTFSCALVERRRGRALAQDTTSCALWPVSFELAPLSSSA